MIKMIIKAASKSPKFNKKVIVCFLFWPLSLLAQERKDDPLPKIRAVSTLNTITGWTKNDIGKWVSMKNAIPYYDHILSGASCEKLLKIEIAKINFEEKPYYCLAKITRFIYSNVKVGHSADYWFFSLNDTKRDSIGNSVVSFVYQTHIAGHVQSFESNPLLIWQSIIKDIKVQTDEIKNEEKQEHRNALFKQQFVIHKRDDINNSKVQFLFGLTEEKILDNDIDYRYEPYCVQTSKKEALSISYYEVSKSAFDSFFKQIL